MNVFLIILALLLAALSLVLLRKRLDLLRRIPELRKQCEKAELENAQLKQALSDRERKEVKRFEQLEHDLRASIGVIVGFSSLLRETLDTDARSQTVPVRKSADAIHQSAAKALRIIDAASAEYAQQRPKPLEKETDRSASGDIEAYHSR